MDDPYTHGVTGGSTTLEQCAAAVLAYNGQDGCVANYFFFESGGYCNCPRDATCSGTPNSNAGGPGQLYHFTGGPELFVVRLAPLELSPHHRPPPTPPPSPARPHSPFFPLSRPHSGRLLSLGLHRTQVSSASMTYDEGVAHCAASGSTLAAIYDTSELAAARAAASSDVS